MATKKKSHTQSNGHPFSVGKHYRNRDGEYEVISIDEPNMVIRYLDGSTIESSIALQARIWENIQDGGGGDLDLELA